MQPAPSRRPGARLDQRLASHLLGPHPFTSPAEVVGWMGALQAQDLGAARWAIGVRLPGATDASVAQALSAGEILRTHVFRGTWQLVAAEDLRWMLGLVAARVLAARAGRERRLGLDAETLRRSRPILERALAGGHRTREELRLALERGGVPADGLRLSHLLQRAELEGLVCSGALRARSLTYALLDDRVPPPPLGPAPRGCARWPSGTPGAAVP